MAEILFFEKSGCSGNKRQKALLEAAGHRVIAHDLREVAWTPELLQSFFAGRPVADWFNHGATAIKSGEIDPFSVDAEAALALLMHNPLLIRRPLMESGGVRMAGFEAEKVNGWLGLGDRPLPKGNLESCANHAHDHDHGDGEKHRCADPYAARLAGEGH
ncbi:MAG: ArsC/Spx/MgsR family protein [Zoogloea sp.]|uniref:ArsC/Spx/MgsR family protein n=1 Tax=Zoogloea sp. TaxID=49181 RepID=UPI003F2F25FC